MVISDLRRGQNIAISDPMTIDEFLREHDKPKAWLAVGSGVSLKTLDRIRAGLDCQTRHVRGIVLFSRNHPTPSGGTIRCEDLIRLSSEAA